MANFGAREITTIRSYILSPPNVWTSYTGSWGAANGTANATDVSEKVYDALAKRLGLPRDVKKNLMDWAAKKGGEELLKKVFTAFPEAKIAAKVTEYFTKQAKSWFYKVQMNAKLPPGFNNYEPDFSPDEYVDYMIWAWGTKGMLYYKTRKKSAAELGSWEDQHQFDRIK